MAIPKIIHYCWFGGGEMPEKEKECVKSWEKYAPDYKIECVNEKNFDINQCDYVREAYEKKAYAFVSDYARAKVLYEKGGIYLDTDVLMIKPFSIYEQGGLSGFERRAFVGTAVIGVEAGNKIIKELMEYYERHHYVEKDGTVDNIANVSVFTEILKKYGLRVGGEKQTVSNFTIYNREVFYPKKISETEFQITDETIAIHTCSNSWMSEREKRRGNNKIWIKVARPVLQKAKCIGTKILGKEKTRKIEIKIRSKMR